MSASNRFAIAWFAALILTVPHPAVSATPKGTLLDCPTEDFDGVAAPALPADWTFVNDSVPANSNPDNFFRTVTDFVDSAPNAVFVPDFKPVGTVPASGTINDVSLISPEFVPGPGTVVRFDNRYNFRLNSYTSTSPARYDGGVLEISIDGGPYQDILAAGGSFAEGGYYVGNNANISTSTVGGIASPIAGRPAWSGMSSVGGVVGNGAVFDSVTSVVDLPAAAIGHAVRLRFRSVVGPNTFVNLPASNTPGWWIDSLGCATPPRLDQSFAPRNAPINTPVRLTLTLSHSGAGATLTSDLVDTLPVGMTLAAVPNEATDCPSGAVSATGGANSFALLAGTRIPSGSCTVAVDVIATAGGIYVHPLTANQLITDAGNNPNASTQNFQAIEDGVPTYGTSFEAGTGSPTPYPIGADTSSANLNGKDGWATNAGSGLLNNVRVREVNPATGAQHARVTPVTPNGNGYQSVRSKMFEAGTTDYSIADLRVAIQTDPTTPRPAPFDVSAMYLDPLTQTQQPIARLRFAGAITDPPFSSTGPIVGLDQSVLVEDGSGQGFVDTDLDWTSSSTYRDVRIVTRRADAAVLVCLDGAPVHIGQGAGADARSLQFSVQRQNGIANYNDGGTFTNSNNIYDVDDARLDNRNDGACTDVGGATAPVVRKRFEPASVEIETDFDAYVEIHNWNDTPIALTADFVDILPAGLSLSSVSSTCSGTAEIEAGAMVLRSGATIPARGSCVLQGTVQASTIGAIRDDIALGDLQTDAGNNATPASATVSVTEVLEAPTLSTSFAPPTVLAGTDVALRVTISNPNLSPIALTADLVNDIAPGLSISGVSTSCGGTPVLTGSSMRLPSGTTVPGDRGSCTMIGTVRSDTPGSYVNALPAGSLQTNAGSYDVDADATLTVTSVVSESVTLSVTAGTDLSPGACGTAKVLTVESRTAVNFCYRLSNHTDRTLSFHSVDSSAFGALLGFHNVVLAPGATHQFNDIRTMTQDVVDTATWKADDSLVDYTIESDVPGLAWEDISATGAFFVNGPNQATIPLSFPFAFFGEPQDRLDLVDGGLGFGRGDLGLTFVNGTLPVASNEMAMTVLPYWDRWSSSPGSLYWEVRGTAPNRRLITQWHNRKLNTLQPNVMRYQAVLSEATGQIAFVYDQVDTGVTDPANPLFHNSFGKSATIGLNMNAARAVTFSAFPGDDNASPTPVVTNGSNVRFTPSELVRFIDSDSVGVMVVSPIAMVDTAPIEVQVANGSSTERNFVIGNSGDANLRWELDPALSASSHFPTSPAAWPDRATLGVDPVGTPHSTLAPASHTDVVPALAFTLSFSVRSLVSMNVEHPETLTSIQRYPVSGHPELDVTGFEFIGNDFSAAYGLAYSNGALHRFDATTGEATLIGYASANQSGTNESRQDMAYDPVTGKLYAITYYTVPHTLNLYEIDPQTAESTFKVQLNGPAADSSVITAIAINGQGQMFGLDLRSDRLVAIDQYTGETAFIGPLGYAADGDQALEFDELTDTLYWIGGAGPAPTYSVFRVDTTTGAATLVDGGGYFGAAPNSMGTSGFAISRSHPCSSPADLGWLGLSETTGVVGPSDTDTVRLDFDTSGLEDGSYDALLCLGSNDPIKPRIRVPVSMTVSTDNLAPTAIAASWPMHLREGEAVDVSLAGLFDDPEAQDMTYALDGALPEGLSFDPSSARVFGTPASGSATASPLNIMLRATDPHGAWAELTLELSVLPAADLIFGQGFEAL